MNLQTPELQDYWAERAEWRTWASRRQSVLEAAVNTLGVVAILAALILAVLGLFPEHDAALYLTAVVLGLFFAALTLLFLVYAHRNPATASDEVEQPAE